MRDPIRVTTATRFLRKIRRWVSQNEWVVWLLGLPRTESESTDAGLVLIQIDGLSKAQLQSAVAENRMPFVKSLLEKEHFHIHTFYSGLPSSTPAVQGELFYGKKGVVPSFGFRDHRTGHLARMFAQEIANDVEARLKQESTGLLEGGGSYCNIYSGGAKEVHFCATSFGRSEFFDAINPLKIILIMLLHFWTFFRVLGLMIVEFFLATFEFFRGVCSGKRFWQELIMIPARVVVVVWLRERVTAGVCYDVARGLPIVHVNYLGYDEQAHRRGPSSKFAHWTLGGIDRSIRKIWKAAHRGSNREYDIWVFSDHGQESTMPYANRHGRTIQEVVAEIVDGCVKADPPRKSSPDKNRPSTRAGWIGIQWLVSLLFGEQDQDMLNRSENVQTVTSSPLTFIYLLNDSARARSNEIARKLVNEFNVPMAVQAAGENEAIVSTKDGEYRLPGDMVLVFGADHPFLSDIAEDLIRMAHHPDSGEIMLTGWDNEGTSTSFVLQNGAHGGPGHEETSAFALIPADVALPLNGKPYLRPEELRAAAMHFLGRLSRENLEKLSPNSTGLFRILTYNVHACVGMDGQLSPQRTARVISQSGADIICLQELDVGRKRSGFLDQANEIARRLEYEYEFHPAWHVEGEQFGNAILTRFPMRVVQACGLHHHKEDRSRRSALWVEIEVSPQLSIQMISTHLSIYPKEQLIQAKQLIEEWVRPASQRGPVILCGDFNAFPNSATYRVFADEMMDVESFDESPARSTLFSPFPISRVDHIFVTKNLVTTSVKVIESRMARIASDHLPVLADIKLKPDEKSQSDGVGAAKLQETEN